ncbi:MAG: cyanophycinase [Cytophagales bacterium]|nr:cyanophycinase [Cytophagales bacterium]
MIFFLRRRILHALAAAVVCLACEAPEPERRGSLIIIGGGVQSRAVMDAIIEKSRILEGGYAVVLPMASSEPDSAVYYAVGRFRAAGITQVAGLQFRKGVALPKTALDSLAHATLIYIPGGDQSRFMELVDSTLIPAALVSAWKAGALIAGTSAGAAVMSEHMITGNALREPDYQATFSTLTAHNLETRRGLGLIRHVLIDQHFVKRSRFNRLISGILDFQDHMGIGIDESTAIVVEGSEALVIGESQVIVITNSDRSRSELNGKIGALNLSLSIYLPGEKFTIP